MKIEAIVRIISRLLAIYVLIRIIDLLQIINPAFLRMGDVVQYMPILSILLYIVLFYILWFKSEWIAKMITQNTDVVLDRGNMTTMKVQAILFSVVGVFILANVIPQIVQVILAIFMSNPSAASIYGALIDFGIKDNSVIKTVAPQLISLGLKILIGLWLMFGAKGIVGLINSNKQE